jgi:HAMP domain-containing protein
VSTRSWLATKKIVDAADGVSLPSCAASRQPENRRRTPRKISRDEVAAVPADEVAAMRAEIAQLREELQAAKAA